MTKKEMIKKAHQVMTGFGPEKIGIIRSPKGFSIVDPTREGALVVYKCCENLTVENCEKYLAKKFGGVL